MEEKTDLNSVILMIGETNARLQDISEKLTKLDRKINTANNTKKEIKTSLPNKMVFTVKRTVTDKYK